LAKAPNTTAPKSEEDWDGPAPAAEVPAEKTVEVVCVSPDRPHVAEGVALLPGQRATIPHSIAKKFFKSRHLVRAEDFDEDMLPKAGPTHDEDAE
jgi:hypothetical protein